jgi:ATP-dependent protease ClpP protease subunit
MIKTLMILFFISSAQASTFYKDENFSIKKIDKKEKTIVLIEGLIRAPLSEEFQKLIKEVDLKKQIELRLDSVGGSIYETQKLINTLDDLKNNNTGLTTRVDQGSMCASSCVPLFVQGQSRLAGNASSFMFHGVALYAVTNIPGEKDTKIMIDTYLKAGIDEKWIQKHIDMKVWSSPNETWYNGKELFEDGSNFVTGSLNNQITFEPYNRNYTDKPR